MTPEAKASDLRSIVREYCPSYQDIWIEDGGKTVAVHTEFKGDTFVTERVIRYLQELHNRHDVGEVGIVITADFEVKE